MTEMRIDSCGDLNALADRAAGTAVLTFPAGYTPSAKYNLWQCGANMRANNWVKARITKTLRADAKLLAQSQKLPVFTVPVEILVVQHQAPGKRTHDAENVAPLGKAAIDGLRDAGVLRNDSAKYVTKVSYTVGERRPGGQFVLHITPVGGAS